VRVPDGEKLDAHLAAAERKLAAEIAKSGAVGAEARAVSAVGEKKASPPPGARRAQPPGLNRMG
jgi:hypothetical protein